LPAAPLPAGTPAAAPPPPPRGFVRTSTFEFSGRPSVADTEAGGGGGGLRRSRRGSVRLRRRGPSLFRGETVLPTEPRRARSIDARRTEDAALPQPTPGAGYGLRSAGAGAPAAGEGEGAPAAVDPDRDRPPPDAPEAVRPPPPAVALPPSPPRSRPAIAPDPRQVSCVPEGDGEEEGVGGEEGAGEGDGEADAGRGGASPLARALTGGLGAGGGDDDGRWDGGAGAAAEQARAGAPRRVSRLSPSSRSGRARTGALGAGPEAVAAPRPPPRPRRWSLGAVARRLSLRRRGPSEFL